MTATPSPAPGLEELLRQLEKACSYTDRAGYVLGSVPTWVFHEALAHLQSLRPAQPAQTVSELDAIKALIAKAGPITSEVRERFDCNGGWVRAYCQNAQDVMDLHALLAGRYDLALRAASTASTVSATASPPASVLSDQEREALERWANYAIQCGISGDAEILQALSTRLGKGT